MNYNDINVRLKRIYASIDSKNKYGGEILTGMHSDRRELSNGRFEFSLTFGKEIESQNQINDIISNIANLKDILKDKIGEQGRDGQLIENEIDQSSALQLILDLSNQEKHGYPLTKTRRSKKDPQIVNISSGLGVSDMPDNIRYSSSNGAAALNVMIAIHADVTDSSGQHLYTFDELINQAIADWEEIINKFQIG